ncbi:MAG: hypothetical protein HOI53_04615 [Francisellaceae bacterium]|jgi:hypothetical protein|nr:hypothetical protein [Francisellaceae bacterium]MBT6207287.1 hypothetical protein [Francisellaceae bacterium]MBT6538394.1 hypothetical protein [Francisellaceae bacterium]
MLNDVLIKSLDNYDSVEKQLLISTKRINQMTKTINAQAKKLATLERQLQKEQVEKQEIQRDYTHIVELVQELHVV